MTRRVELDKPIRNIGTGSAHPLFGVLPFLPAQLVQLQLGFGADVFVQHVKLCRRHIQKIGAAVLDLKVVFRDSAGLDQLLADILPNPMVHVYDIVADIQILR